MNHSKVCHIIVAAGSGSRFGGALPKQFCNLHGRPLLMTTIGRMREVSPEASILLVLSEGFVDLWLDKCRESGFESPDIVVGGITRWHSVRNALSALPGGVDVVTVHDGARPVITRSLVRAVVGAVEDGADGAIPAVTVTDSIRQLMPDGSSQAVDRALFRAVQTPQGFRADALLQAYSHDYRPEFTDDASVMEFAGFRHIALVEGSAANIKVTHPFDMAVAAMLLDVTPASH